MMSVQDDYFGPSKLCGHGNLPDVCHHCKYEKEITTLRQQLTEAQERVAELEEEKLTGMCHNPNLCFQESSVYQRLTEENERLKTDMLCAAMALKTCSARLKDNQVWGVGDMLERSVAEQALNG